MNQLSPKSNSGQPNYAPNVYTPSLEALNESIAMEAFNNFIRTSPLAKDLDEAGKIGLYLDYLKQKNSK